MLLQKSGLASLSPSTITDGTVYVALKCFFDGSEKVHRRLTLAAFAGDETEWAALEAEWAAFLAHVGVPYSHMKDIIGNNHPFKGWPDEKRDWFVHGLATIIDAHKSSRLRAFTCTVDMRAHAEFKKALGLPPAARLCMRGIIPKIFQWYGGWAGADPDAIDLYFDRCEPFMRHIEVDWKRDDFRQQYPVWDRVRAMVPVDMRMTPGVQVADLFAWTRTRFDTQDEDRKQFSGIAGLLCHPSSADHWLFDRAKIETYRPEFN